MRVAPSLCSERLSYERLGVEHADGLAKALCDPRVWEFIEEKCPTPAELTATFARLSEGVPPHRAGEIWLDFAVRRESDGALIGRLEATLIEGNAEVAYLFGPDHWGQGYGRESLTWLHKTLKQDFGATDCWATINPANLRSLRLASALGYTEVGEEVWPRLTSYDPGDAVFRKRLFDPGKAEQKPASS